METIGETQDYRASIEADVPLAVAFERIGRVTDWWNGKGFTGRAREVGDTFTVRFGETWVDFEIVHAAPDRRVVWKVNDSHLHWLTDTKEWNGTSVVWELEPEGGRTRIRMTHRGLTPRAECFERCREGWDFFVGRSLLELLVHGRGRPDREHEPQEPRP